MVNTPFIIDYLMMDSSVVLNLKCLVIVGLFSCCVNANFVQFVIDDNQAETRYRRDVSSGGNTGAITFTPEIRDFNIVSTVNARYAVVNVNSRVLNQHSRSLDTAFVVQVPLSAFISNFKMVIGNETFVSKVFPKAEAQKKFDDAKEKNKTAGQVRHEATNPERGMDIFRIDINLAANTEATFYLTYEELLERRLGNYLQTIVIQPGQVVENLTVTALVNEEPALSKFTYRLPNSTETKETSQGSVTIKAGMNKRELHYIPTVAEQQASSQLKGLHGELILTYDVSHEQDGGIVIVKDDYFVHYFSPSGLASMDKNIMFVIDVSGSMEGRKIEQTREAMMVILNRLNPNDYFNILIFDDEIRSMKEAPIVANQQNVMQAKQYVEKYVEARGSTDINMALVKAILSLRKMASRGTRPQVIVLLTDGQPTSGETEPEKIRSNVRNLNEGEMAIFCLGFGFHLNFELIENIAYENNGRARRIYEDKDAAEQLQNFYAEIKNPVLTNLVIDYDSNVVDLETTTKRNFFQYYDGTEVVIAGKTRTPNVMSANGLTVVGMSSAGQLSLPVQSSSVKIWNMDEGHDFTEKLWAYTKIKELIAYANAHDDSEKRELALNMSLKYKFVTPLTSFVLIQGDEYLDGRRSMMNDVLYARTFNGSGGLHFDVILKVVLLLCFIFSFQNY